jgi:hypothetical protein
MAAKVRSDVLDARRLGISGTPTFLLGHRQRDGRVTVDERLSGLQAPSAFEAAIQRLIDGAPRARTRYLAPKRTARETAGRRVLDEALASALPEGGVGLEATAAPVGRLENARTVAAVTISVRYPPLASTAKFEDRILTGWLAVDAHGELIARSYKIHRVSISGGERETPVVVVYDRLDLPGGRLTLRTGIWSEAIGRVGTVHLPMEISEVSPEVPVPIGILLGRETDGLAARGYELFADLVPFEPTTSRMFDRAEVVRVMVSVLPASSHQRVSATATILQGDKEISTAVMTSWSEGEGDTRRFVTTLPLKDMPSGDYRLLIRVAREDGTTAEQAVPFAIR